MRITKWVPEHEVELDLGVDDLEKLWLSCIDEYGYETEETLFRTLNDMAGWMTAIPDHLLRNLDERKLRILAEFLDTQARRFRAVLDGTDSQNDGN